MVVELEAMTGGTHDLHATSLWVFLLLYFAKNVAGEQRSLSGKVFLPPEEQDPIFNLDSLMCELPGFLWESSVSFLFTVLLSNNMYFFFKNVWFRNYDFKE